MTTEIIILGVFVSLGILVIWYLHRFIHQGHFSRSPVERDGEPWYVTPVWLRLPLLVAYGFTATMLLMIIVLYVFDNDLLQFRELSFKWIGFIDTLLGCLLFLVEYGARHGGGLERKYITMLLGFIVGATFALAVFKLVQS